MNITFCVSSIPNHRIVSGMRAAIGILRANKATGITAASSTRHEPATNPSGTPTAIANPKPANTRRRVAMMLSSRSRSFHNGPKLLATSTGEGRITGEIKRCSGAPPKVARNQSMKTSPTAQIPTSKRVRGSGATRSSRSPGAFAGRFAILCRSVANLDAALLGGFQRIDLHFHTAVLGLIHRVGRIGGSSPAHSRRGELVRLERGELLKDGFLHCVGAVRGQLLDR